MNKILEISGLTFSYGDGPILKELDCTVAEGEFTAIIGDNGAGKSTLLDLILGNLKAGSGEIRLFGDPVRKNNHYGDIAYISQNSVMGYKNFPTTTEEVIKIHMKHLKVKADIEKYLGMMELEKHAKKMLRELSGGQLQRVGLLLAMIKDAGLIILDEPTTGVDKKFSHELYIILRRLAGSGKTILMVTHHLSEVNEFVDRVLQIKDGKCIECHESEWRDSLRGGLC